MATRDERTMSQLRGGEGLGGRRLVAFWDGNVVSVPLPAQGRLTIGRGESCDLRIDHASISRRHAVLHVGAQILVEDLGSRNGTRIACRTLARGDPQPLPFGTVVEAGAVTLAIQSSDDAPPHSCRRSPGEQPPTRLDQLIDLVAASRLSILLLGETGVGKEVTAERIHRASPRAAKPLVPINCAAVPDALLEGELFGYERGAFTGAQQRKLGLFETADGGTVFLDEIGELPLATQAKLLRVLETRQVQRLGALRPQPVDVRFIAATNRDLERLSAAGEFRSDLFYRLNGMAITIPPLRDRIDELPGLVRTLLGALARDGGAHASTPDVTPAASRALASYPWPGNIRELKNVLERATVLARGGPIGPEHLLLGAARPAVPSARLPAPSNADERGLPAEMNALERQRIVDAMEKSGGNQTHAAKLLGISRRILGTRLETYGLARSRKRG